MRLNNTATYCILITYFSNHTTYTYHNVPRPIHPYIHQDNSPSPQNRSLRLYSGHTGLYSQAHTYKVRILTKQPIHQKVLFFYLILNNKIFFYIQYVIDVAVLRACNNSCYTFLSFRYCVLFNSSKKYTTFYLYNQGVSNGPGIHLDTNRRQCCMLRQPCIFHTHFDNYLRRNRKHNLI